MNHGTAAGVRARGFTLPAAGKTGTSRDGWFAGFTNNLVCVIWVGFDDNRDLGLPGGTAAAPIWADFMIKATTLAAYKDVKDFQPPEGVQIRFHRSRIAGTRHAQLPDHPRRGLRRRLRTHATLRTPRRRHNVLSSTGSWLSHVFGGGDKDKKDQPPNRRQRQPAPLRP